MLNGHGYGMHFFKKGIIYFFDTHMHREKLPYLYKMILFKRLLYSKSIPNDCEALKMTQVFT